MDLAIRFTGLVFIAVIIFWLSKGMGIARTVFASAYCVAFIVSNCIGLLLPEQVLHEATGFEILPKTLLITGISYLPFVFGLAFWTYFTAQTDINANVYRIKFPLIVLMGVIASLYFATAIVSAFLVNGGFEVVGMWGQMSDRWTGYQLRYDVFSEDIRLRFSSGLCAFILIPALSGIILVMDSKWSRGVRLALVIGPLVLSCVRALANLQRGPAIVQFIIALGLISLVFLPNKDQRGGNWLRVVGMGAIALLGFVVMGAQVFHTLDATIDPVSGLFRRVTAVTSHTGSLYYSIFPSIIDFRGLLEMFFIPIGSFDNFSGEQPNLKLIGFLGNGYPHNANANFIATAYSGAGWVGVIAMSLICICIIVTFSAWIGRFGWRVSMMVVFAGLQGMFIMTQADFFAATLMGFFISQSVFVIVFRFREPLSMERSKNAVPLRPA